MSLFNLTLYEAHKRIKKKDISAKDLLDSVFKRIDDVEKDVNSFITITKEKAYKDVEEIDKKLAKDCTCSELMGIPMAVKDNICTKGIRTTCGSKMLENFIPPYSAEAYEKLEKEGAIIVGKANMDEFAMGSSTKSSYYKTTKNPWDLDRVPGGSSGGSAAAVAAGEAFYALGSDTGGSIRQPASFCGVVGMKPSYGAVSRFGTVAYASTLEQVGVFTKDIRDCAILLNYLYGYDKKDSTTLNKRHEDFTKALVEDIKGMKIGLPKEYFGDGIDKDVKDSINRSLKIFEGLGAYIEEVSLPHSEYALPVYYIMALAEASSNLARFDGVRFGYRAKDYNDLDNMYIKSRSGGFGEEVKNRILLGTHSLINGNYKTHYDKALRVRRIIKDDFDKAFQKYDLLIIPAYPTVAFKINDEPLNDLSVYMADLCTVPINIVGLPAVSIPCGFTNDNLPIGMQIVGKHLGENSIIKGAYAFESNSDFSNKRPAL